MVLVDTSVWINHLQAGNAKLKELLLEAEVFSHPFIIGELACGNLINRAEVLALMEALPLSLPVTNEEFHHFLNQNKLMGRGIGFVDIHILASARISGISLWTEDKNLKAAARELRLSFV